jgi:hypothetical protein
MAANDRFYQINLASRPAFWGDLGNRLQLSGFLLAGEGASVLVLSPNMGDFESYDDILRPSVAEWWDIIRATDDPCVFELDSTGGIKAVHRKMRYTISGAVQQKIWARDDFICQYCFRKMGEVQLTVDHFEPIELGGADDPTNYLSACRKCNKSKGSMPSDQWCLEKGCDSRILKYQMSKPLP